MAQKIYSRQEVEALDVDGVVQFAQEQGLDEEDVAVLRKRKIRGRVLQSMTVEEFMKAGLELGPAKELMLALDKVFGRGPGSASGDTENKGQEWPVDVNESNAKQLTKPDAAQLTVLKVIKGLFAMRADAIRQLSRVSLQLVVEMEVTMLAAGLEIPTEVAQNYKDACQERLEAVQRAMELRKLDEHFTAELLKRQNEKKTNNNSPTH